MDSLLEVLLLTFLPSKQFHSLYMPQTCTNVNDLFGKEKPDVNNVLSVNFRALNRLCTLFSNMVYIYTCIYIYHMPGSSHNIINYRLE